MEIFHTGINRRQGKLQTVWVTFLAGKYDDYGHQEERFCNQISPAGQKIFIL